MSTIENIKERFELLKSQNNRNGFDALQQHAINDLERMGIPTSKHEEWKYTRIGSVINKDYRLPESDKDSEISKVNFNEIRLPGSDAANELVFVNGFYSSSLSTIRSEALKVSVLADAATGDQKEIVSTHLGHSRKYMQDGINALNTAFSLQGVFVYVEKNTVVDKPVYIYNITDSRVDNIFAQPRSLVYVDDNARLQIIETYITLGLSESFTNQVMEIIVAKDASVEYYKIQNDANHSSQVSTTHIRQIGKSYTHSVVVSLDGSVIRNNMNVVMEADYCEAHLYGLYFPGGKTHIDNHTLVDNVKPNCFSNELYKGILKDNATGVFNGKIFVQPQAQKTNAYQSNKNILLSEGSSVNTKPQLEIFADDVKCSHGCTIGRLNDEALFYMQSRGISINIAQSLLVNAFARDVLEHIKPEPIRHYVDQLIAGRLEFTV